MDVPTTVASGVRSVADDYDAACKRLLSERQVLSRMLHDWLDEFTGVDPSHIERECLVGEPRIGEDPVGRDEVAAGRVVALAGEDATLAEGTTTFDVRFEAIVPDCGNNERDIVQIEVDVEAQNVFSPGYPLLRRGVFYCGRLLSLQGSEIVPGSHYERVRKVVSIWVCAHPPRRCAGTVTRFALRPESLVGDATYDHADFDLIEVIMACLDDRYPGQSLGALGMLEVLLSTRMGATEKLGYLEDHCGIVVSETACERVIGMCNLSQGVLEEGRAEGLATGLATGRAEGLATGRAEERDRFLEVAAAMVRDGTLALQEAAARFGFSEQELSSALA